MRELLRSNDLVLVSFVVALLQDAGIACHVADAYMSIAEGSIGAFPRRLMVADEDEMPARRVLTEAGLAGELRETSSRGPLP